MKRCFEIEWDDVHGLEFMNEDYLFSCIKTKTHIKEGIGLAVKDITIDRVIMSDEYSE